MQIAKRVMLFILVNFLVITTLSVAMHFLGVGHYMTARGIDYRALIIMCVLWGFGGSFISLLISKQMAKWSMGVKVIDVDTRDPEERWLVQTVHILARKAGIETMPEVGWYESPEVNAFATGPSKNSSLVCVSSGLMDAMNRDQAEAVLGHEIAHVSNGDMVTMTLLQGVINVFVLFLSRLIGALIAQNSRDERGGGGMQFLVTFGLQIVLSILGSMVVAAFSRWREFRADAGGARLAGKQKMISALLALKEASERRRNAVEPQGAFSSLKISGGPGALFATHPPLEVRIERLRAATMSELE